MNIEFLTELRDNPCAYPNDIDFKGEIEGIPLSEIEQLEQAWNNGIPFPKALRELLFLAGNDCYVLDTGLMESQQQMQEDARLWMTLEGQQRTINRPFYVIEVDYNERFTMLYLDEGDDPNVHFVCLPDIPVYTSIGRSWKHDSGRTLKDLINFKINMVKQGRNPF